MNDRRELVYRIAFQKIFCHHPFIGSQLLGVFGNATDCFRAEKKELRPLFRHFHSLWEVFQCFSSFDECEHDLDRCYERSISICIPHDEDYPHLLKQIYDPPPVVMIQGVRQDITRSSSLAIVGARKASSWGRALAFDIARGIASRGLAVVSGMAYGIDAAAHEGALCEQAGTIAVWGTGLDVTYPAAHHHLAEKVRATGAIISEFPLAMKALRSHFPQRNRVVSGLSLGVVVVEAAEKSGSLITVRSALEQGRLVFAVPGAGGQISAKGTNQLLKDGAILVENADDVLLHLKPMIEETAPKKKSGQDHLLPDKERALDAQVCHETFSLDEFVFHRAQSPAEAMAELTHLELEGRIEELPGHRFRRVG